MPKQPIPTKAPGPADPARRPDSDPPDQPSQDPVIEPSHDPLDSPMQDPCSRATTHPACDKSGKKSAWLIVERCEPRDSAPPALLPLRAIVLDAPGPHAVGRLRVEATPGHFQDLPGLARRVVDQHLLPAGQLRQVEFFLGCLLHRRRDKGSTDDDGSKQQSVRCKCIWLSRRVYRPTSI